MACLFSGRKCRTKSSSEEKVLITKGDDIMSDVEKSMFSLASDSSSNCYVIFMRTLRKNISKEIIILNRESCFLNYIEWMLFFTSLICSGLISCGVNITFDKSGLSLTQFLGIIVLLIKSVEKSANLSHIAHDKKVCANTLSGLVREICFFEMEICNGKEHTDVATQEFLNKINKIWGKYDDLELKSFAQPSFEDKSTYGSFSPAKNQSSPSRNKDIENP